MTIVLVVVAGVVVGVLIEIALSRRTARRAPEVEPIEGTLLPPPPPSRVDRRQGRAASSDLIVGEDGSIEFRTPRRAGDGSDAANDPRSRDD